MDMSLKRLFTRVLTHEILICRPFKHFKESNAIKGIPVTKPSIDTRRRDSGHASDPGNGGTFQAMLFQRRERNRDQPSQCLATSLLLRQEETLYHAESIDHCCVKSECDDTFAFSM